MISSIIDPAVDERIKHMRTEYNAFRVRNNMTPATYRDDLASVALAHSVDMVTRHFFSHQNPDGLWPWDRVRNAGIKGYVAECIGAPFKEAPDLLQAWINSPSHLEVLEDTRFTHIGIGIYQWYWTMLWLGGV